jgi:ABC-type antimicrobial peptide transport system, permease component
MSLPPALAALRKHKAGVILIGLQVALTLAIVCNIAFIIGLHVKRIERPTGLAEDDLFVITQRFINTPTPGDDDASTTLDAMQLADLTALRGLPEVEAATPVTSLSLRHDPWRGTVGLDVSELRQESAVNTFTGDEHALQALGLTLVEGRNFNTSEVAQVAGRAAVSAPAIILTRSLATRLFPGGKALGKPVYFNGSQKPSVVIGVVARLLTSDAGGHDAMAWDSVLLPVRMDTPTTMYAVRARPGRLAAAMKHAESALFSLTPMRVIEQSGRYTIGGVEQFSRIRSVGYAREAFMAEVLLTICTILLAVTGLGITGLTSFWVSQRTRQIGIRRALGATQRDILRYFQVENLFIVGGGCMVGTVLAIAINVALLRSFELAWMSPGYLISGIGLILLLGQVAVFLPARRASRVPPVVATRG